jgi:RNA polymerase sigma factor for flagellar operon FliA
VDESLAVAADRRQDERWSPGVSPPGVPSGGLAAAGWSDPGAAGPATGADGARDGSLEASDPAADERRAPRPARSRAAGDVPGRGWLPYRQADEATREAVVTRYLPLVKHIASRLAMGLPAHVDQDELYSFGVFGLLDALERFDPSRGVKFETYAYTRIKGAILDGLRSLDWVPASLRQRARQVEEALWSLESRLGRPARDEEVAEHLGLKPEAFAALLTELQHLTVLSLDEVWAADREEGEFTLADFIEDGGAEDPLESARLQECRRVLAEAIEKLPPKERMVVSLFYYDGLTPKEIAAVLNLSVSRISQLHSKAILRLRGRLARLKEALL